ncbi:MAG: hypothetical protein F4X64_14395 [Chloroflexi bacterium]|nr:hypothetical protein [Chloroflexota bacterium]
MGIFSTTVLVGNLEGGYQEELQALVDTGASDSMFPASLLEYLHVHPRTRVDYVLADGSEVTYGRGQARLSINDRDGICPVIFGPEGDDNCLVGATTLQILMLTVDSTNETLIPTNKGRLGYGGNL